MPELAALIKSVNELNSSNEELAGEVVDLRAEIARKYLPRAEAKQQATRIRKWIVVVAGTGILVAATVGVTMYLNHETTCGVRGVLTLAQTTSTRNPIPNDLSVEERARVETQREAASQFYDGALEKLPILWEC